MKKLVNESINKILQPKDPKKLVEQLIEEGNIGDKYTLLIALFDENYERIREEFEERGIDSEDLIDSYINFWGDFKSVTKKPGKLDWILSDILRDNLDNITVDLINNAFE